MSDQSHVQLQRDGSVAIVTLNRPEAKNALTPAMAYQLAAWFRGFRADTTVRSVVLTGAGNNFSAGGDIKGSGEARSTEQARAVMVPWAELTNALAELDKPVIAALDGVAYGAGVSLACLADLVLVSERVRMAVVFHRIGLVPDVGAWYTLPRLVGLQRAKELVYSAREFGADEAKSMGLALEILPPDELMPRALALAHCFDGASSLVMSLSKRALNASLQSDLSTMLEMEASGQGLTIAGDYVRESVRRFAAKEPAQFSWPARSAKK
ncbi:MAG: enoyl-CoA hydratase/isomerase family protein [Burkholderiales bacterium]